MTDTEIHQIASEEGVKLVSIQRGGKMIRVSAYGWHIPVEVRGGSIGRKIATDRVRQAMRRLKAHESANQG